FRRVLFRSEEDAADGAGEIGVDTEVEPLHGIAERGGLDRALDRPFIRHRDVGPAQPRVLAAPEGTEQVRVTLGRRGIVRPVAGGGRGCVPSRTQGCKRNISGLTRKRLEERASPVCLRCAGHPGGAMVRWGTGENAPGAAGTGRPSRPQEALVTTPRPYVRSLRVLAAALAAGTLLA